MQVTTTPLTMYDSRASIRGQVTRAPVRPVITIIIIIVIVIIIITDLSLGGAVLSPSGETLSLLHLGAGTIRLEIASCEPIICQYSGHVISIDEYEVSISRGCRRRGRSSRG